ncbi:alpha/beta fold hydrolase [Lentzea sp. NPDC058436]|uniref:alpha/beta fold hydrolase n=1 Tax=Lentzea sp. NPDC058436 TaxID=3346499 RepID=UPI00364C9744
MPSIKPSRRVVALGLTGAVLLGLATLAVLPERTTTVPDGAAPGSLTMRPCEYDTEAGALAADCGTLVVPENRRDPASDLIALPVTRIRATTPNPGVPVFRLGGGPGATNLNFPQASRLTGESDVVLVGYRGIDGSRRLDCPEVALSMRAGDGIADAKTLPATAKAFELCAKRLTEDGVDLTGYSIAQRIDDIEAARTALGHERINLFSTSAGTRTAMIYSWRHPEALQRSVMLSVNTPGHLFWDPATTDSQFGQYTALCRADAACSARTPDLAASIRDVATDLPDSWGPLAIKDTNVRVLSQYAMHHNGRAQAPNSAPTVLDAYLSGDTGALWAMSVLGDMTLPDSLVWGEFASFAMIDAPANQRYYDNGGDHGSILGNASTDFLWAGPSGVAKVWPDSPDNAEYRTMRPSDVETLVISGEVDLSTPSQFATKDLLPSLSRGKQVVLAGLGHTYDFWEHRPEAGRHLLTTFYATGQVDSSRFDARPVAFDDVPLSMSTVAKLLVGVAVGGALLGLAVLGLLARSARRRGGYSSRAGAWIRALTALPLGLGGWFLGVLVVWTINPDDFVLSATAIVPGTGVLIGLGAYLAWVRPEWARSVRRRGVVVAIGAALAGALLGTWAMPGMVAPLAAVAGAAAAVNLALVLLRRPEVVPAV